MAASYRILLILLLPVVAAKDRRYDRDMSAQVFDGYDARQGQFPFIGSLRNSYDLHVCGVTLIRNDTAVTAAHCFDRDSGDDPDFYPNLVVFGDLELFRTTSSHHHSSFDRAVHVGYDSVVIENDIALIYLKSPILQILGKDVSSIPYARTSYEMSEYFDCYVIGWGETRDYYTSNVLQYTRLELYNNSACENVFGYIPDETTLCAGSLTADACQGDSGGPLACYKRGDVNNIELVGVVSFGIDVCQAGTPGIYTRVSAYQDWIESRPKPNHASNPSYCTSLVILMSCISSYIRI